MTLLTVLALVVCALSYSCNLCYAGPFPDLPNGVSDCPAVMLGDSVFVFPNNCNKNECYYSHKLGSSTWNTTFKGPVAKNTYPLAELVGATAVSFNNTAFVIGGFTTSRYNPSSAVTLFDPVDLSFTPQMEMSQNLAYVAAFELDGQLYVIGGAGPMGPVPSISVFDIVGGAGWSSLPDMTFSRDGLAAGGFGNTIVAIGGHTKSTNLSLAYSSVTERYDIAAGSWTSGADSPIGRAYAAYTSFNCRVYIAGGEYYDTQLPSGAYPTYGIYVSTAVTVYSITGDKWTSQSPLPTPVSRFSFVTGAGLGNLTWAGVGGAVPGQPTSGGTINFKPSVGSLGPYTGCVKNKRGPGCGQCAYGYYGSQCTLCPASQSQCDGGCNGNGACGGSGQASGIGSCNCSYHFQGALCDRCIPFFSLASKCLECTQGRFGSDCAECPGGAANPCNGHGKCSAGVYGTGKCTCDYGWSLSTTSNGTTTCGVCTTGFWGAQCQHGMALSSWIGLGVLALVVLMCFCYQAFKACKKLCCPSSKEEDIEAHYQPINVAEPKPKRTSAVAQLRQSTQGGPRRVQTQPVGNVDDVMARLRLPGN